MHLKPFDGSASIVIDKPITLVGRHPDCDYVITDGSKISRKHCCLALIDSRVVVRDLDSMNGVWVNGDRVEHTRELTVGDSLKIGSVPFQVTEVESPSQEKSDLLSADSLDLESTLDALGHDPGPLTVPPENDTRVVGADGESVDIEEVPGSGKIEFSSAVKLPPEKSDEDASAPSADLDD